MTEPPGDRDYDVFFSYDRADAQRAERLANALRTKALRVWIDSREIVPSERWLEEIEAGLRASRVYAMLVTRHALQSRWVMDEYYAALSIGNTGDRPRIVPVLAEEVRLPVFLSIRQWVDFRAAERFDAALQELVECIRTSGTQTPDPAAEPAPAHDPQPDERPPAPRVSVGKAEVAYLDRALARERRMVREMWLLRGLAVVLGIVLSVALAAAGAPGGVALGLGVTLFVALVGWAATSRRMAAAAGRENRLLFLREKLEECGRVHDETCDRLQPEFWRLVHGDTGAGATTRGMDDAA